MPQGYEVRFCWLNENGSPIYENDARFRVDYKQFYLTAEAAIEQITGDHYTRNWRGYRHGNMLLALRVVDLSNEEIIFSNEDKLGLPADYLFPACVRLARIPAEFLGEKKEMINIKVGRPNGKLTLFVDAKGLHDTLDSIGVEHDGTMYKDRPASSYSVANNSYVISTETLLRREYPAKFDLSAVYTNPPGFPKLKQLCESAYEQARKILEHYQPIDISVDIQKKILIK